MCKCQRSKDSSFSVSLGTLGFPSVQPQTSHVSTAGVCYFPECHAAVGRSGVGVRTAGLRCFLNNVQLSNQCCVIATVP